jgi:capsular exopolysaccharide synthesis family protein
MITSSVPQEGKSMVAANLACALAQSTDARTLLLEGDVRRPSLAKMLGIGGNAGLCEWLEGGGNLEKYVYRLEDPGLWILPAGIASSNPLELFQSERLPTLMNELKASFDWVIIDTPPVLPLADTSIWARVADGILLVTRQGVTEKRQLQRGLEALESRAFIGAVANCSTASDHSSYYYRPLHGQQANDKESA